MSEISILEVRGVASLLN